MMSGWTDLVYSLYADQTRHLQSVGLLKLAAQVVGHPGPDLTGKLEDINANRPAVLIANAWGDTIFPPNQLVDFYNRLAGPKRLELRPGDHAIAELTGVLGLPND